MSASTLAWNAATIVCLVVCYGSVTRRLRQRVAHTATVGRQSNAVQQRRVHGLMSLQAITQSSVFALFVLVQTPSQFHFRTFARPSPTPRSAGADWWVTLVQVLYTMTSSVDMVCVLVYQRTISKHVLSVITCRLSEVDAASQQQAPTNGGMRASKF